MVNKNCNDKAVYLELELEVTGGTRHWKGGILGVKEIAGVQEVTTLGGEGSGSCHTGELRQLGDAGDLCMPVGFLCP